MRLVGYLRVSTDLQETGLDVQRAAIEAWAAANGHTVKVWAVDEGVSGKTELEGRSGFADVLRAVTSTQVRGVVVYRLDRLARDLIVQEQILRELWRADARVYSVSAAECEYMIDDPQDPSRKLIRQILGAVSEYERAMIRLRMEAGARRKVAAGGYAWGKPPYGWRAVEGRLVPDGEEQRVIEEIRRLRKGGRTLREVAELLNLSGVTRPGGGVWQPEQVRRVLDAKVPADAVAAAKALKRSATVAVTS